MSDPRSAFAVSVGPRLDRLPLMRFHWRMLGLVGSGLFLDSADIFFGGAIVGVLLKSGWSTLSQNATFVMMTFIGMTLGAWCAGLLGDRFGRRVCYQVNLAIFGLASLAAVCAPNMTTLIVFRFIMGIGMGAEIAIGYATMTEFAPRASRAKLLALTSLISNSSAFFGLLLARLLIPTFGWRSLFLLVGIAALVVWFMRKNMPESPRWLAAHGRAAEAEAVLATIEREVPGLPAPTPAPPRLPVTQSRSFLALFSGPLLTQTLLAIAIVVVINIALYGFLGWLPTFFVKQGKGIATSLTWTTVMSLGAPCGCLLGVLINDRISRKWGIAASAAIAALLGIAYPLAQNTAFLLPIGFLLVTALFFLAVVGQALYVPEVFPTALRLRGAGAASTAGRLAGAGVQHGVIFLFMLGGVTSVISGLVILLILLSVLVAIFGIATRSRALDEIATNSSGM